MRKALLAVAMLAACGTDDPPGDGREGDAERLCDEFTAPAYESTDPNTVCVFDVDGLDYFHLGSGVPIAKNGGGVSAEADGSWSTFAHVWTEDLGHEGIAIEIGNATECVWRRCNATRAP